MNLTVSPQMRIVALVGVLAVVGLAGFVLLHGKQDSSTPSAVVHRPVRHVVKPKTVTPAKPVRPAVTPSKPKPQLQPAVQRAMQAGLPLQLARKFARHDVVVVELYSAAAPVDQLALAEATAGAHQAGAGFLPLDVDAQRDATARALVTKLGVLESPTLMVFRAPGTLFKLIKGFSDQETVAQAAANAAASTPPSA
jgi:thiol:disulfide interchange protein